MYNEYLPAFVASVIVISVMFIIMLRYRTKRLNRREEAVKKTLAEFGAYFFLIVVGFITLSPTKIQITYRFDSSFNVNALFSGDTKQIINVLLFVPVVLCLVLRFTSTSSAIFIFVAFFISVLIEMLQYLLPLGRIASVNDVVLNTIGGIIGCVVGMLILRRNNKDLKNHITTQ